MKIMFFLTLIFGVLSVVSNNNFYTNDFYSFLALSLSVSTLWRKSSTIAAGQGWRRLIPSEYHSHLKAGNNKNRFVNSELFYKDPFKLKK